MLHVHRGARADHLVGALADVLAAGHDDPFTPDLVAVHAHGIERWLAQELAVRLGTAGAGHHDGVCANVDFRSPRWVVGRVLAAAAGLGPDDDDPWADPALAWRLLELLADPAGDVDAGPLRPHLDDPTARFGAVRRVADLIDRYAVHRPDMLLAWSAGDDVDAAGQPLAPEHAWQARLWRALLPRIGVPPRPVRLGVAVDRLEAGTLVEVDLPARVCLFGLTALPVSEVRVLRALAAGRDVHLFLLHPAPALWERVAPAVAGMTAVPTRDADPTRAAARHPLLGSWGRDVREAQLVLAAAGVTRTAWHGPVTAHGHDGTPDATPEGASGGAPDAARDAAPDSASDGAPDAADAAPDSATGHPPTLLARLQADVRADRPPPGPPVGDMADRRARLVRGDRSVQVHGCHGRTRQVEVLRDAIGHLLAADDRLEPRDIVVLCPEVEEFAPLVHAVFGADAVAEQRDDGGLPQLRVRLADRSLRRSNPLFDVVTALLELADSRVEASRVLDLATRAPVRRRFRLDDDDLARIETWVGRVGVRWGLDGDHRAAFDLAGVEANTWRAGLDRLLVGVAVADEELRTVGPVVPYDVEGDDVDVAGRLAELVARLDVATRELRRAQPIADWCRAITRAVDRLADVHERDTWQRQQLDRVLDEVVGRSATAGEPSPVPLTLHEVRGLLADRLRGRPSWANHRTGDLTVCTLVPMRAVPHRVVCLLGMDDAAFPRRTVPDGDDLIAAGPRVGDRDARTEDRQLLLDALLAASDALVVTYTARDERTNEPRPPAVPIGELLDTIDATVVPGPGVVDAEGRPHGRARDAVVATHPLQAFDPRNFVPGHLGVDDAWSFERTDLDGARALRAPRSAPAPFLAAPLPPTDEPVVALDDLVAFLHHPVKAFLSRRLGVRVPRDEDARDDAIPVEADPLAAYAVGDRRLDAALAGRDRARWEAVERGRGELPPGRLADPVLDAADETVAALLAAAAAHDVDATRIAGADPVEIDIEVAAGDRALVGAVGGAVGDRVVRLRYARLGPKDRLAAYAQLVAVTAAHPERPWTAVAIGRNKPKAKAKAAWCRLGPLGDTTAERRATAREAVETLLDLYDRGTREPLPLYCRTSSAYAEAVRGDRPDRYRAARTWDDAYNRAENAEPEHVLVLGAGATYETLLDQPLTEAERGPGWPDAPSRFEALALRLWLPVFACREEGVA